MTPRPRRLDADALLVRRTALRVGLWITVAVTIIVVAVLAAALWFVLHQVPLIDIIDGDRHEEMVDIGGLDALIAGVVVGALTIVLAGTLALIATRRAVAPLVDALARQRRFVADASHELRTPLAVLDARLQVLERELDPTDPHRGIVAELREDSRDLIGVVNDLLDSVDVVVDGPQTPIPAVGAVTATIAALRMLAEDRGVALSATPVPEEAFVALPEATLQRALVALVDNAIKHSPPGESVVVRTEVAHRAVHIDVIDHGGGIQGIAPERVFERFARSSDTVEGGGGARSGFGIGLALVHDAITRFGGSVEVRETSSAGTAMRITLRRARP